MSRKGFQCPNCGSEFCSAIRFWRDGKQSDSFDLYACHDCGQVTQPGTVKAVSHDWQPERKKKTGKVPAGQVDLFGNITNIRDIINQVPKFVESPAGNAVIVSRIYADSPKSLRGELKKMVSEMFRGTTGRNQPFWYKYRKIKRRII